MTRSAKADVLRYILAPPDGSARPWMRSELGMILDHELAATLLGSDAEAAGATDRVGRDRCACTSHRDFAACDAGPCAKTTRRVKDGAKKLAGGDRDYPGDVARVIYLLAVLRAKRMRVAGITSMSDDGARREVRRALAIGWLSEDARRLLRICSAFLFPASR